MTDKEKMIENEELEKRIVNTCLERYNGNLAGILIFGSYNTKHFVKGKSDLDLIILFKEKDKIKFHREQDHLSHKEFADIPASIIHFRTLNDYKKHIYEEGSWSSWITVIVGSKIIYSTREFEKFREYLEKNPIPNNDLLDYLKNKDDIELDGYFIRSNGWNLTKAYFSHLRRKLQILNYLVGNKLEFDYGKCLRNLGEINYKSDLIKLGEMYSNREEITNKKTVKKYYNLSKKLTDEIRKK